jgi:8-oxo-dGTP pyrophosphatase MutT (NUDIX family)
VPLLRELERALNERPLRSRWSLEGKVPGAVCLPLRETPEGVLLWAIKRPAGSRHHSGEIAFPGGKPDPEDASLLDTALREMEEELGVARAEVRLLGRLVPVPTATSHFYLHPFVVEVAPDTHARPSAAEVAALITMRLDDFFAGRIPYSALDVGTYTSPIFGFLEGQMYGATAHILEELLVIYAEVAGLTMPAPERATRIPWV